MTDDNLNDAVALPTSSWVKAFFLTSIALVVAACAWIAYIAIQISSSASQYSTQNLALPTFEQYAKTAKIESIAPRTMAGLSIEDASKGATAQQIFEWVADFENGRAIDRIKKIPPLVSGVVPAGIAERIGIRAGDEIMTVHGAAVRSVFEVYEMLDQRPDQTARITLKRGGKLFSAVLTAPAGSMVNSETSGLLFEISRGLHVVTKSQSAALASQFETRFVQLVPPEWRRQYLQNVARFVLELQPYVDAQRELTAADAGFVRIEDMLSWHHEAFSTAIEKYAERVRQANVGQLIALGNFGDAVIGLVSALALFFVSLWFRSRYAAGQAD